MFLDNFLNRLPTRFLNIDVKGQSIQTAITSGEAHSIFIIEWISIVGKLVSAAHLTQNTVQAFNDRKDTISKMV